MFRKVYHLDPSVSSHFQVSLTEFNGQLYIHIEKVHQSDPAYPPKRYYLSMNLLEFYDLVNSICPLIMKDIPDAEKLIDEHRPREVTVSMDELIGGGKSKQLKNVVPISEQTREKMDQVEQRDKMVRELALQRVAAAAAIAVGGGELRVDEEGVHQPLEDISSEVQQ